MKTNALLITLSLSIFITLVRFPVSGQTDPQGKTIFGPKYGKDSLTCVINFSLYRETMKQYRQSGGDGKIIEEAITPWRWVFNNCPLASENIFIDGITIMEYMIGKHKDAAIKEKYIDTLMMVYDRRIAAFGKEGEILERKGEAMTRHRPENNDEIFSMFNRAIGIRKNHAMAASLVHYFRAAEKKVRENAISRDDFFGIYEQLISIVDFNTQKHSDNPKELAAWDNVRNFIEQTVEPYATCNDLVAIFGKKMKETPNNIELLYKIIKLFDRKGCTDQPLYLQATLKAYELDPSPESAFGIGRMYFKNKEFSKAVEFLKEAEKLSNPSDKADGMLLLASCYKSLNTPVRAREAALKALDVRNGDGNALILIGDLYAESAKDCGTNDLTTGAVYWAAVDKYLMARRLDPSVAEAADSRINVYSRHFPSHETIFFYGYNEGDSYRVECWINETTTVRPRK